MITNKLSAKSQNKKKRRIFFDKSCSIVYNTFGLEINKRRLLMVNDQECKSWAQDLLRDEEKAMKLMAIPEKNAYQEARIREILNELGRKKLFFEKRWGDVDLSIFC